MDPMRHEGCHRVLGLSISDDVVSRTAKSIDVTKAWLWPREKQKEARAGGYAVD